MEEAQYIKVRVTTQAKKETIEKKKDMFYISVKEKAREGKANARVTMILSKTLHCTPSQLRMIQGGTSPSKKYLFSNNT